MRKLYIGYIMAALALTSLAGCSGDDKMEAPLAPPVVETKTTELSAVGYNQYVGGDLIAKGIGNYYFLLSNATCDLTTSFPTLQTDGDLLLLDLYATASADESAAIIPDGTYNLGFKHDAFTFNIDNSLIVRRQDGKQQSIVLSDGMIDVKHSASGEYEITCDLVKADGGKLHYSFKGKLAFEDVTDTYNSNSTLRTDMVDTQFTGVTAIYNGNMLETGTGNFMVYLYTDGFDENMNQPGSMLTLCFFSQLANDANKASLREGTYEVSEREGFGNQFTLFPGMPVNGMPFGTYAMNVDQTGTSGTGYVTSGTVDVKKTDNTYTFTYDLQSDNRKKITGTYTGEVKFENQSEDDGKVVLSTLENDVKTDMSNVKEGTYSSFGKVTNDEGESLERMSLWLHGQEGDVMVLEFCVPDGMYGQIPEGTYKITDRTYPNKFTESSAVSGFLYGGSPRGTWYLHYEEGKYYLMDAMAPAIEGTVTVKRSDDIYTFEWNVVDDSPAMHKITGGWSGQIRAYDPNIDGKSMASYVVAPWAQSANAQTWAKAMQQVGKGAKLKFN